MRRQGYIIEAIEAPVRRAAIAAVAVAALFATVSFPGTQHYGAARAQWQPRRHPVLPFRQAPAKRPAAPDDTATDATAPALAGAPDPVLLLVRMIEAEKTLPYEAREATFGAGRSTEERVKHDPVRGVRRESIRPPGEIFVDDYHQSWLISDRNHRVSQRPSLYARIDGANAITRIRHGKLRAQWVGVEQIAGRLSDIVSVVAASGNPDRQASRRFWIDRKTGLRLRSEDRGPQGRILSGAYYLSIDFTPSFGQDDFTPPHTPDGFAHETELKHGYRSYEEAAQSGLTLRRPDYLPGGFRLRGIEVLDVTRRGQTVRRVTQRFDNGLSVMTLVQTTGIALPKRLQSTVNPTTGAGFLQLPRGQRGYIWRAADASLTYLIMGSLPDDELKRIADSLR